MADRTTPEPGERSFEDLLASPLEQFGLPPELLASIMAYSTAPSGTVGAQPLQPAARLVCLPAAEVERLRAELAEVKAERDTNFSLVGRLSTGGFACATQLELMTAERDALNACIRATCSAARIAREVGDHRKVVLLSDVERLLTVPELPPLSPPDGGQ